MKTISVENAVGCVLCHDVTEIVDGVKGKGFRRGHVVREEDVEALRRMGKRTLYVWDAREGFVHEDDAARRIAQAIAGPGTTRGEPREGRIDVRAARNGLLVVNLDLLQRLNSISHVTIATRRTMREAAAGDMLAGTRVTPLVVPEETLDAVEECCRSSEPLIAVRSFKQFAVAVVSTGSELVSGKIQDAFGPVLQEKFASWGSDVVSRSVVTDEPEAIAAAIENAVAGGATLVAVTGGMSVDPDDKTPAAIKAVCRDVTTYGAPVFPGAMFMLGYKRAVPVLGLPGCVMYRKAGIFDLVMPRILAGERVTRHDVLSLAHGGLCESCPECVYPRCGFGK